ncbi:MAG: hypothetical protein C0184_01415 [Chloroflexus aggregans]|uniref:Periplasmic heavy metal sensor n=1 Tax=Chloroflexus aggregans TaxID=152260 RepID=A0A2J6XEA0_9CHLR|nr:MAG: hypothetical protein C0184_01415 [Chloroflexus aggregans]
MKRIVSLVMAAVAGALATMIVFMVVMPAFAQGPFGPSPTPVPAPGTYGTGQGGRGGRMQPGQDGNSVIGGRGGRVITNTSLIGVAANQLGISQQELVARLMTNGSSIADELKAVGIDPQTVVDTFVASRAERLSAAVAAGRITQAQADAQLAIAKSMTVARLMQPFTPLGPGGLRPSTSPVRSQVNN